MTVILPSAGSTNWDGILNTAITDIDTRTTDNSNKIGDLTGNGLTETDLATAIKNDRTSLSQRVMQTTADITYYVDTSNGNDSNNGLASGTAFKTISKAISLIPQTVNHNITLNVASGTYSEVINLTGFNGKGYIKVIGASALSDSYIVQNITTNFNTCRVRVQGFKCSSATVDAVSAMSNLLLELFYIKSDVSATGYSGITILNSLATVLGCMMSNRSNALYANQLSIIASRDWSAGSGNTCGITSNYASTVGKSGVQPQGTTAENSLNGGVIR